MKTNYFSITFWFNIVNNHTEFLDDLRESLKDEFSNYEIKNITNNLFMPVIIAINNEKRTNLSISQINMQYNMDKITLDEINIFKNKALTLFELLKDNDVEILHTSIYTNLEIDDKESLKTITKNIINKKLYNEDLIDVSLKFGKKHEDLFYKIINLLNKKHIKLPRKTDDLGNEIPLPLISWNDATIEKEIIDIIYEINDKYLYDYTKNYHTTEFYLNKMLYILENDIQSDINNLIEKGEF